MYRLVSAPDEKEYIQDCFSSGKTMNIFRGHISRNQTVQVQPGTPTGVILVAQS
jgi:hypothetical protein